MYITSHTILIYYNNYYYDNSNSYLFLFFIFIIVSLYVCMRVYCAVLSLVCVCVRVGVLSYVSSHMLIHVYLCVFTPHHPPRPCCGEEADVLI